MHDVRHNAVSWRQMRQHIACGVLAVALTSCSAWHRSERPVTKDVRSKYVISSWCSSSGIKLDTNTWILDISKTELLRESDWDRDSGEVVPLSMKRAMELAVSSLRENVGDPRHWKLGDVKLQSISVAGRRKWFYVVQVRTTDKSVRHRYVHSIPVLMSGRVPEWKRIPDPAMSAEEMAVWNAFAKRHSEDDLTSLNEITEVKVGEFQMRASPASPIIEVGKDVQVDLVIKNMSRRSLVLMEPDLFRFTVKPYSRKGFLTDKYSVRSPGIAHCRWLRILSPGEKVSVLAVLEPRQVGQNRIMFSLLAPRFVKNEKFGNTRTKWRTVSRCECTFEVVE